MKLTFDEFKAKVVDQFAFTPEPKSFYDNSVQVRGETCGYYGAHLNEKVLILFVQEDDGVSEWVIKDRHTLGVEIRLPFLEDAKKEFFDACRNTIDRASSILKMEK